MPVAATGPDIEEAEWNGIVQAMQDIAEKYGLERTGRILVRAATVAPSRRVAARRVRGRAAGVLACLYAASAPGQAGPFGHLHAPPRVVTSGSGEAIWFSLDPSTYVIILPDGFQSRNSLTEGDSHPAYKPGLSMHCRRSSPEAEERGFESGEYVEIVIPRMRDDPTAALAVTFDPRYWIRELTGRSVREVPMDVSVNGGGRSAVALRIHRTDYSAPRPPLYAYLPERAILELVAEGRSWTLEAVGEDTAFSMLFPPGPPEVQAAARGLLEICVPPGQARSGPGYGEGRGGT